MTDHSASQPPTFPLPALVVPGSRYAVFLITGLTGLLIDLWSKEVVFRDLGAPYRESDWEWTALQTNVRFRFLTSFNEGALWGIGQGQSHIFAILSVIAILGIWYWLFIRKAAASLWVTVALGFVLSGTLGNLYDRLGWHGWKDDAGNVRHAVRDFLYFRFGNVYDYPIFNVADMCLVTGALMLVAHSFWIGDTTNSLPTVAENPAQASAAPPTETPPAL